MIIWSGHYFKLTRYGKHLKNILLILKTAQKENYI